MCIYIYAPTYKYGSTYAPLEIDASNGHGGGRRMKESLGRRGRRFDDLHYQDGKCLESEKRNKRRIFQVPEQERESEERERERGEAVRLL